MRESSERLSVVLSHAKPSVVPILAKVGGNPLILGAGFVVDSEGQVATCLHVVSEVPDLSILLLEKLYSVRVVQSDSARDLALLASDSLDQDVRPLELGTYSSVEEGDEVMFSGYPFGIPRLSTHRGMIAYKGPIGGGSDQPAGSRPQLSAASCDGFQLDGTVNRGNSGGPVIHLDTQRVVGVITATHGVMTPYLRAIAEGRIRCEGIGLGQVDIGRFVREIAYVTDANIQLGVGYAISADYLTGMLCR